MYAAGEAYKLNKNITFFLLIFLLDQYFEFVMCSVYGMYGVSSSNILHGVNGGWWWWWWCCLQAFTALLLFEVLFEFVDIVWAIPSLRVLCVRLYEVHCLNMNFQNAHSRLSKKKFSFNIPSARSFQLNFFFLFIHPLAHLTYSFSTETVFHFFDFNKWGKIYLDGMRNEWRKSAKEMG